jgi:hypothetical protein
MIDLCDRNHEGLVVKLWYQEPDEITITVRDERSGENFAIEVAPSEAIDAYYHPFAYRDRAERACLLAEGNAKS